MSAGSPIEDCLLGLPAKPVTVHPPENPAENSYFALPAYPHEATFLQLDFADLKNTSKSSLVPSLAIVWVQQPHFSSWAETKFLLSKQDLQFSAQFL